MHPSPESMSPSSKPNESCQNSHETSLPDKKFFTLLEGIFFLLNLVQTSQYIKFFSSSYFNQPLDFSQCGMNFLIFFSLVLSLDARSGSISWVSRSLVFEAISGGCSAKKMFWLGIGYRPFWVAFLITKSLKNQLEEPCPSFLLSHMLFTYGKYTCNE